MDWAHLPYPGGLFAQDPEMLDAFKFIFAKKNEYEAEQDKKQQSSMRRANKRR